jgi:hypothetical protein
MSAGVLVVVHDFNPPPGSHSVYISTHRRDIHLQSIADLSWASQAQAGGDYQDIQLACLETQGAQSIVVHLGNDPVEQPQPHCDAVLSDEIRRRDVGLLFHCDN